MTFRGYQIRRDGTTITDAGSNLSAHISGLTANTEYDFEVRSYNAERHYSPWSAIVSETTLFLPSSLSGLVEWLKADAITGLADNDPISTWTASAGNNATAAGTARPTYQTNEQNGLPIVRFDGVNDAMAFGNFSALTAGEVFIVIKIDNDPTTGSGARSGLWTIGTDGALITLYPYDDGVIYDGFGSTARKTVGNPTPSLASWRVYNVFSAANDWGANLDGSSLFTTATNTVGFSASCVLGAQSVAFLDGDVAEFIMYNRKLTAPERASVLSYLETKWAI